MAVAPLQPLTFVAAVVSYILCFVTGMWVNADFQYRAFINQVTHGRFVYAKVKRIAVSWAWGISRRALCCGWPCMPACYVCGVKKGEWEQERLTASLKKKGIMKNFSVPTLTYVFIFININRRKGRYMVTFININGNRRLGGYPSSSNFK